MFHPQCEECGAPLRRNQYMTYMRHLPACGSKLSLGSRISQPTHDRLTLFSFIVFAGVIFGFAMQFAGYLSEGVFMYSFTTSIIMWLVGLLGIMVWEMRHRKILSQAYAAWFGEG